MLNKHAHDVPPPPRRKQVSDAGERLLSLVRQYDGPVGVDELATKLGKHTNTIREQLNTLVNAGFITRSRSEVEGRGRPAWYYQASSATYGNDREVIGLAAALANQIERSSDDPHGSAVEAGERWGSHLLAGGGDVERGVFWMLDELGFAPELEGAANRMRLHACPLAEIARDHPVMACGVHHGVIRGVVRQLGGDPDAAQLEPKQEPATCLLTLAETTGSTGRETN